MVGNIATETLLETLSRLGVEALLTKPLDQVLSMSGEIATRYRTSYAAG